jgi:glutamine synthetase
LVYNKNQKIKNKMKIKLEYIWLDGNKPEPMLRSKTKIYSPSIGQDGMHIKLPELRDLPQWTFDGSSTGQAEGNFSDLVLNPVKMCPDPLRDLAYLVLCEVLNPDGTPHSTNHRGNIQNSEMWIGFEQEYFIRERNGSILGWKKDEDMKPQGDYYCGVGANNVSGRNIMEDHLDACLSCGLEITGTNAEVALGQWEYQLFSKNALEAADDLWISRYILERIAERYNCYIEWSAKPVKGDWNGSGLHTNFSTEEMREEGGKEMFDEIFEVLQKYHDISISSYGSGNKDRLTGKHETQSIDKFTWGVSDRGASIRIPLTTKESDYKGYLEDRRPASNANPYLLLGTLTTLVSKALSKEVIEG